MHSAANSMLLLASLPGGRAPVAGLVLPPGPGFAALRAPLLVKMQRLALRDPQLRPPWPPGCFGQTRSLLSCDYARERTLELPKL